MTKLSLFEVQYSSELDRATFEARLKIVNKGLAFVNEKFEVT